MRLGSCEIACEDTRACIHKYFKYLECEGRLETNHDSGIAGSMSALVGRVRKSHMRLTRQAPAARLLRHFAIDQI